jgi:hypothetical protein
MTPLHFGSTLLGFVLAFGMVFTYSVERIDVRMTHQVILPIVTYRQGVETDVPCSSSKCLRAWRMLNINRAGSALAVEYK